MGKGFELLGLAGFNVIIALILTTTFLSNGNSKISSLTESTVETFINEVAEVSGGLKEEMDSYSVTSYFMDHISESGKFTSTIEYAMPEMPPTSRTLEMDKMKFISHVLQGMKAMNRHETAVEIEYIKIADNGKSAMVTTTNYERGVMPVEDAMGETRMMPVTGTSYCEQELVLNNKKVIQMAGANCSTNIDFSDSY